MSFQHLFGDGHSLSNQTELTWSSVIDKNDSFNERMWNNFSWSRFLICIHIKNGTTVWDLAKVGEEKHLQNWIHKKLIKYLWRNHVLQA